VRDGNSRYQAGSMATSKGFTGQYNDSLTALSPTLFISRKKQEASKG